MCNLVQTRLSLLAQRCGPVARKLAAEAHGAIVRGGVAVDDGHAPVAFLLDAEVVTTHLDAEPAIFAPVRACKKSTSEEGANIDAKSQHMESCAASTQKLGMHMYTTAC